jgi:predicted flap endonuclease-1-like 5' DNA nuclease
MGILTEQIALYLLATVVVGAAIGWLIRGMQSRRRIDRHADEWQTKLDQVSRERDRLTAETTSLRSTIESQQAIVHKHEIAVAKGRTELESAHEKAKLLSKNVFTLRAEREDFKNKLSTFQDALVSVKQQAAELQAEFVKSGNFYKGELAKSFEKRKLLEAKLEDAKLEHESFANLLQSTRSEHESVNKILASAQTRLDNLDALEQSVIELEAENAQLKHDTTLAKQENEALQRDVAELDELKVQNKELAQCLTSMESSRKQYEDDAKRYKQHAGQFEQKSDTLRLKLDEVEKNFLDIEKQQDQALKEARMATVAQESDGHASPEQEEDDLQEIVGIGKVFEQTLHELGIFSYRQIAAFGVTDIARINRELKEFKGRMEQDDWIGQAKDLHFRKYGGTGELQ